MDAEQHKPLDHEKLKLELRGISTELDNRQEFYASQQVFNAVMVLEDLQLRLDLVETAALEVINLLRSVGDETGWDHREQTDRVYAWYELDELRKALGEGEGFGS